MAKKFAERHSLDLTQVNRDVLADWQKHDIFHKTISEREGCPRFIFFEGPPSANGHPGIHHVLARSIKDTFLRYKTMQGFQVNRKAGWDTHGLPVEINVEKELGITKKDIGDKISVEEYNRRCHEDVLKFTAEWRKLTEQMGYFIDLDHPYVTYHNKYIETLWWLLKQLYQKGLLYKGYTIQPYSPSDGTGLSSHELNQPGCYRDVKDTTVTAQFTIEDDSWQTLRQKLGLTGATHGTPCFLAWTTTPWTLPSNVALCVGPDIDYAVIETENPYNGSPLTVIMAAARIDAYFKEQPHVIAHVKGRDLDGLRYRQLMPWVKPCEKVDQWAQPFVKEYAEAHPDKVFTSADGRDNFVEMADQAFRVILGDYVTTEDGTGIVHNAPTFGADDLKVCREAGVPALYIISKLGETRPMVDLQGKYYLADELDANFIDRCVDVEKYSHHAGDYVKNAYDPKYNEGGAWDKARSEKEPDLNLTMCLEMKAEGEAFKIEKHVHTYPHSWRTDKPIIYYPLDSWFIRDTACKEQMVALNKTIGWHPESTGSGRFGNWLENLNDWNLSRSRFWGTPLPIWRDENRHEKCIGSLEELYAEIEKSVKAGFMTSNPLKDKGFVPGDYAQDNYDKIDLHRPYIDRIILVSDEGMPMHREADLIDVWFDSGSMPYAQLHYPFEGNLKANFPADFISEGVDQTRGWFFTLHAIATMVFGSVAFKNVISTGLVLDAQGRKMSKHVGNVIDPFEMLDKYGADAVRFFMLTNSEPWDNLQFDPNGVDECRRKFFGTLHNTYSFFALYANVDGYEPSATKADGATKEIDRWILSCLNSLVKGVTRELDNYDPTRAGRLIDAFVNDDLSNWWVRLNRKRFWGKEMDDDKRAAYDTLFTCLMTVTKLLAPFAPFYADQLYHDLGGQLESVHLDRFPVADEALIDKELEERMALAQKVTSMTLALRRKVSIKVRQPLQQILIPATDDRQRSRIESVKDIILSEVNVKELNFAGEEQGVLVKKVKCNFRVMGKKYGKLMKGVAAHMSALSQEDIAKLEKAGSLDFQVDEQPVTVDATDVEIYSEDIPGWLVSNDGSLTVALEVTLTPELKAEGMARELVNRIQNIRKDSGLEITDRINVTVQPNPQTDQAVRDFGDYIASQVLANSINVADNNGTTVDFDDFSLKIEIKKS